MNRPSPKSYRLSDSTLLLIEDLSSSLGISRQKVIDLVFSVVSDNFGKSQVENLYHSIYKDMFTSKLGD